MRGDCLDTTSLDRALASVHTAYYLVHSMAGDAEFAAVDRTAALNFGRAAAAAGVRRIVYLGGLTSSGRAASEHLKSRAETGEHLRAGGVPVVEFRAAIVIGAGSLSYEMLAALVERLPVMVCPRWVATLTQPIAIADVVAYLMAALDLPDGKDRVFEIGGPDQVSYGDMLRLYARLRGLRRLLLPVPFLTPRLSGLWLALVAPAQARVGRALVEGLRSPTVVRSSAAHDTFAITPMPLINAMMAAIAEGTRARVLTDTRTITVDVTPARAFAPIRRIGGAAGWYFLNMLWGVRGKLDGWLGGVGLGRGRRDPDACTVGDAIDGWTVEAYEPDTLLRLSSDWRLPGRAWLEFQVTALSGGRRSFVRQTATFDPRGLVGRAYWYALVPVHSLLFHGMLQRIGKRATTDVTAFMTR